MRVTRTVIRERCCFLNGNFLPLTCWGGSSDVLFRTSAALAVLTSLGLCQANGNHVLKKDELT